MTSPEPRGLSTLSRVVIAVVIGVVALIVVVGVVLGLILQALTAPRDGDAVARTGVERTAQGIADDLGYWTESTDAETLAAERFTSAGDVGATVRPIAWTGTTSDGGATIDVRITLTVDAESSPGFFQPSQTAGSAERCYRFTVRVTDDVRHEEILCSSAAPVPEPTATQRPALADDAEMRLTDVLSMTDVDSLAGDVAEAFPEDEVTIETAEAGGELVAAVGVAPARDCVVMVRHVDGTIERVFFDRIQLEPGELGCSTRLYTNPPR